MDLVQLNSHFGISGALHFSESNGLVRAEIKTADAEATVYLQGAHVTRWQPTGQVPVLFLSRKTELAPGKAIRGGVPISFPWFAIDQNPTRYRSKPGPSHGFARIQPWTVAFAALSGADLRLTLTLAPSELSREMGFDHFGLIYEITIGSTMTLQLTVVNGADQPLHFEEALHTYFAVEDIHEITVTGLESTSYIDKTANMQTKPAEQRPLTFVGPTDRVYANTTSPNVIHDGLGRRVITNAKSNSYTTVIFNPWKEMSDLGSEEWHEFVCVETANVGANAVTLAPGSTHVMQTKITVTKTEG